MKTKWFFDFSILALIWSIYYLAKRITGNTLTTADMLVCGAVIAICIGCIVYHLYRKARIKKDH